MTAPPAPAKNVRRKIPKPPSLEVLYSPARVAEMYALWRQPAEDGLYPDTPGGFAPCYADSNRRGYTCYLGEKTHGEVLATLRAKAAKKALPDGIGGVSDLVERLLSQWLAGERTATGEPVASQSATARPSPGEPARLPASV